MFEYKPLEKSAKKEKDYSGQSALRMKLRRFDLLLVPIESTYDVVERVPVIGRFVSFSRTVVTLVVAGVLIALVLILLVAIAALIAVQLQQWAPNTSY